jgi:O-antigen/teichoic acid export membrane protein
VSAAAAPDTARRMGAAALILGGRRLIVTALSIVATAIVARHLGPGEFGGLAAGIAVFGLALAASDLGFTLILGREMAVDEPGRGRLLRAVLQVQTAWSVLLALVVFGLGLLSGLDTPRGSVLAILAPAVAASGLAGARQLFFVRYETRTLATIDLVLNVLQAGGIVIVVLLGAGPGGVAVALAAGTIFNSVLVALRAMQRVDDARPTPTDRRLMLRRALPFGISSLLGSLYFSIDLVFLGWLVSPADVGNYAAAVKVLAFLVALPGLVMSAALPGLAAEASDRAALAQLAARVSHWTATLLLPFSVGMALFAGDLVPLAFGAEYADAVGLTRILSIAAAVACLCNVLGTLQVTLSLARSQMLAGVVGLALNVVANLVFVPSYGIIAAAWITVVCEVFVAVWALASLRGRLDARPVLRQIARPLPSLAAFVATGVLLSAWPIVAIPTAAAVLVAGLVLTGAWPEEFGRLRPGASRA